MVSKDAWPKEISNSFSSLPLKLLLWTFVHQGPLDSPGVLSPHSCGYFPLCWAYDCCFPTRWQEEQEPEVLSHPPVVTPVVTVVQMTFQSCLEFGQLQAWTFWDQRLDRPGLDSHLWRHGCRKARCGRGKRVLGVNRHWGPNPALMEATGSLQVG